MPRYATLLAAILIAASFSLCACSPGGTVGGKSIPPTTQFAILGDPGTPFTAVISDSVNSWPITGVVPLNMAIVNNQPPVRMVATKLTATQAILSIEVLSGFFVSQLASTTDPFGTVSVQTGGTMAAIAPAANPDVRFAVKAPAGELFTALIEDQNNAFVIGNGAVPALFLFERPSGRIDGLFTQQTNLGSFDIDLIINGSVLATGSGGPSITVKEP